jgi:serine/threonine-protein kinase
MAKALPGTFSSVAGHGDASPSTGVRASRVAGGEPLATQGASFGELAPGDFVEQRYCIRRRLGSGAMGVVYLVDDVTLERPAALKMVDPALLDEPLVRGRFLDEARALARLRHENVAQIYAFGIHGAAPFFAMEFVDGDNLDEVLERCAAARETLPVEETIRIVRQVAAGLSAAHARGLVHGDVKPSNIVLDGTRQRAVIIDFGIARKLTDAAAAATGPVGTPSYMAPEQVLCDDARIGPATDVYSLACTAFEMLSGTPVFDGDAPDRIMAAHVADAPPALARTRAEYAPLDAVLAKALSKHPDDRHASCVELAAALEAASVRMRAVARQPRSVGPSEHVLILASGSVRTTLVREVTGALARVARAAAIDCVATPAALVEAFERRPARLVLLDDDSAEGVELVSLLERLAAGAALEVIRLTRDSLAPRSGVTPAASSVQRVPKPFSARGLATTLDRACSRLGGR